MLEVLEAQVLALRAQIDALLATIDSAKGPVGEPPACSHPETEDAGGTFGNPRRRCTSCRAIVGE